MSQLNADRSYQVKVGDRIARAGLTQKHALSLSLLMRDGYGGTIALVNGTTQEVVAEYD